MWPPPGPRGATAGRDVHVPRAAARQASYAWACCGSTASLCRQLSELPRCGHVGMTQGRAESAEGTLATDPPGACAGPGKWESAAALGGTNDSQVETSAADEERHSKENAVAEELRDDEEYEYDEDGILDLTNSQLHSLTKVKVKESLREIDLTANRLTELEDKLGNPSELKILSLQKNQLSNVERLSLFVGLHHLDTLVLRDNELQALPEDLSYLTCLRVLDVSFNELRCACWALARSPRQV
eukprot:scaffold3969_cov363-Prasinococcus_capsulatus_cf.AAC.5